MYEGFQVSESWHLVHCYYNCHSKIYIEQPFQAVFNKAGVSVNTKTVALQGLYQTKITI